MTDKLWARGFESLEQEGSYEVRDLHGTVPSWLNGILYRNGPARNSLGGEWFPHWFDGDGMISSVKFGGGRIYYTNKFVKTNGYEIESKLKRIATRGFGKMIPGGIFSNIFRYPANVSNTSILMTDFGLMSLWEGGEPYLIDRDTLETIGTYDFGGAAKVFSAHPKVDPDTNQIFNFGIEYDTFGAKLFVYEINSRAINIKRSIRLPWSVMNHDFVLTKNYMVFCFGPILLKSTRMFLGLDSYDKALHWVQELPTKILIIPRNEDEVKWIEADPFFQFHFVNGFEHGSDIVIDLIKYPNYNDIGQALRDYWKTEWPSENLGKLTRMRIDCHKGVVSSFAFETGTTNEFPHMDGRSVGKDYQYSYIVSNPDNSTCGWVNRLTKTDMHSGKSVSRQFRKSEFPGEPIFVPKEISSAEDHGIILLMIYNADEHITEVLGIDARDIQSEAVFRARLNHHIPFPLHGTFVKKE